jgi:hypothetical protein
MFRQCVRRLRLNVCRNCAPLGPAYKICVQYPTTDRLNGIVFLAERREPRGEKILVSRRPGGSRRSAVKVAGPVVIPPAAGLKR